jgi:hypothetical protein
VEHLASDFHGFVGGFSAGAVMSVAYDVIVFIGQVFSYLVCTAGFDSN